MVPFLTRVGSFFPNGELDGVLIAIADDRIAVIGIVPTGATISFSVLGERDTRSPDRMGPHGWLLRAKTRGRRRRRIGLPRGGQRGFQVGSVVQGHSRSAVGCCEGAARRKIGGIPAILEPASFIVRWSI